LRRHRDTQHFRGRHPRDPKGDRIRIDPPPEVSNVIRPPDDPTTEDEMTAKLTFVAMPKAATNDPLALRRKEIVQRLTHQKKLAEDSEYKRVVKSKGGIKSYRVSPMWKTAAAGQIFFSLRGVEFSPGKDAIAVKSMEELPAVIDALVAMVEAGEFDQQIAPKPTKKPTKSSKA
jgi:hypothetical protein